MAKVPTMVVRQGDTEVVINAADFDPKVHARTDEPKPVKKKAATKKAAAKR